MEEDKKDIQIPLLNARPPKKRQYLNTNIFDTFILFWVGKFVKLGKRQTFQQDEHWNLRESETSLGILNQLSKEFNKRKHKPDPLMRALAKTCYTIFLKSIVFTMLSGLLGYAGPLLIRYIIQYIQKPDKDIQTGVLLVCGIVFSRLFVSIFSTRAQMLLTILGINTSNAVNALVYEKSLRFSLIRSAEHSVGSLINHIQVDSQKLYFLGQALGNVIALPLLIAVGIYLMYAAVGISFVAGITVLIIMTGINFFIGRRYFKTQKKVMIKKDERMKLSNEVMGGIKYIKMSGWEEAFLDKVTVVREEELGWIRKQFWANSFQIFSIWLTPMIITTAVFAMYILLGNEMTAESAFTMVSTVLILQRPLRQLPSTFSLVLESRIALTRVNKFLLSEDVKVDYISKNEGSENAIKVTNGNFYWLTEEDKKVKKVKEDEAKKEKHDTSLKANTREKRKEERRRKRQEKKEKEREKKRAKQQKKERLNGSKKEGSIVISSHQDAAALVPEGEIKDDNYKLILEDVNIEIKKGAFVAVLGDVGSGKSSFLFSLVGEMAYDDHKKPEVELNGEVSYVTQQPWILNATVKENVIFGVKDFDPVRYQEAIKYSNLESDLDILVNKDATEIGEKGVNLSGGQKARVSLARSLYRDSDIYLLDDPLSAVDAHVGNFILKECFVDYLKDKTRVLVTHKFESLKYVDYIYVFHKGKIVESGTLETLKDSEVFQEIERKYNMQDEEKQEKEVKEVKENKVVQKDKSDSILLDSNEEIDKSPSQKIRNTSATLETIENAQPAQKDGEKEKVEADAIPEEEEEAKKLQQKLMLAEDRKIGDVGWIVYKSYFNYYGGWPFFGLLFFLMVIFISLQTVSNYWLSYWSDHASDPSVNKYAYFGIYAGLGLSYAFFNFVRVAILSMRSVKCSRLLHNDMLKKLLRAPVNLFFDRVPTGRIVNRLSKDLTDIDSYISMSFGFALVMAFGLFSDIVVCLIFGTIWATPLVFIFFYASFKIQRRYMRINREVVRLEGISKSPIVSFFSESLGGLTSIRAYNEQDRFMSKFHELQDANIKNLILKGGLYSWFNLRVTFCSLFVIAPSIAFPILLKSGDALTAGTIGLLITYIIQINDDIIFFLWAWSNFESKLISLERCRAFTKIDTEAESKTQEPQSVQGFSESWPTRGAIEFQDYSVKYRPNLPEVLQNVNVFIRQGEKIGVVGRTGSGKSTIFLSLLRIIESNHGSILIDGVDISKLGLDDLRRKITIIPQDPMLFKGTLRDNLDLFNKHTDEELWHALEKVCMKDKFEQERGLDTDIKEGGDNLSAGEKQLLCIGRATLVQNNIILFDEATSNIDPTTEQTILDTIRNSFKDCTVITVAHRLKTIIDSDKVLVMGAGEVLEFDKPQTLVENETSNFHKLWMEYEHANTSK